MRLRLPVVELGTALSTRVLQQSGTSGNGALLVNSSSFCTPSNLRPGSAAVRAHGPDMLMIGTPKGVGCQVSVSGPDSPISQGAPRLSFDTRDHCAHYLGLYSNANTSPI